MNFKINKREILLVKQITQFRNFEPNHLLIGVTDS